jgi:adenylate cyclase
LYDSFAFTFGASLKKEKDSLESIIRRTFLNLCREYAYVDANEHSGASGVVVFLKGTVLYTANVGDTMAVLCRNGTAKVLSQKHFAWNSEEASRIRDLNGFFDNQGNVQGECNVTRAFGHFHLLPFVNANPYISVEEIVETDEFIIMGCDGFWSTMNYQTAVDIAMTEKQSLPLAAKKLRDVALSYGAKEAITVSVVSAHPNTAGFKTNTDSKDRKRRQNDVSIQDKVRKF